MPRSGFVGREATVEQVRRLFSDGARLVTLTGSAGVGKSGLAAVFSESWPGSGAARCDLGAARERSELFRTVASAVDDSLGAATVGEASARAIGYSLAERDDLLLVLDNLDPMLDAAASTIREWMQSAPEARFLITSRERLGIADEHVLLVHGLELPRAGATGDEIRASPAVRLFVDRTRRVRSDFELDAETAPIVAALVRELEGNPLAIELCAARGATLGPSQLLTMSPRLDVLRGSIDRSWDLLSPSDRAALACVSVFRGGFELEAAAYVLSSCTSTAASAAVETLSRLVDKSLVRADPMRAGRLRYRIYAAIGDYVSEKLDGDLQTKARRAHAEYFARETRRSTEIVDFENSIEAQAWALAQPATDVEAVNIAAAIALALEPVFLIHGPADGYAALLDPILSDEAYRSATPPESLARLNLVRGLVHVAHGAHELAQTFFETAVSCAASAGDRSTEAFALSHLSSVHIARGQIELGAAALSRAKDALEKTDAPRVQAFYHRACAYRFTRENRKAEALAEYEAALRVLRRASDPREEAIVLGQMGVRHFELGNLIEARNRLERAIELLTAIGERRYCAHFSGQLGAIDIEEGDLGVAETRIQAAATQLHALGDRHLEAWFIAKLGNVAFLRGDPALAARRYGDALLLFEDVGDVLVAGLVRLRSAMARASLGRVDEAARELAAAERALDGAGYRGGDVLRRTVKAHVERARARALNRPYAEEPPALSGETTDVSDQARFALEIFRRASSAEPSKPARHESTPAGIVFATDASWFEKPGAKRVELGRRGALRKIAARMLAERQSKPGVALSVHDLFEAGWPGQNVEYELTCNRVYAAISRLRSLGLGPALLTRDDGYLLDPELSVRIESGAG